MAELGPLTASEQLIAVVKSERKKLTSSHPFRLRRPMMQLMMLVRKLKWVTSTNRVHMHFRETSANSVFPAKLITKRSRSSKVRSHTFDFGFQELQELLISPNKTLLPFTKPCNNLSDLLRLFLFRERTNPISGDDVFKDSHLGQDGKFSYRWVIRDRL